MQTDQDDATYLEPFPKQRRSKLGIASLALSILGISGIVGMLSTTIFLEVTTEGGFDEESSWANVLVLSVIGSVGALLLGVVIGVAGLCQKSIDRTAAAIGLGVGILGLAISAGLALLGSSKMGS